MSRVFDESELAPVEAKQSFDESELESFSDDQLEPASQKAPTSFHLSEAASNLYGNALGLASTALEALHRPAEAYEQALDQESMRPTLGQSRAKVAIDEAMRQSAKLVVGLVADPTNWPFLLAGGPEVRPALRAGADALFGAMQTVQAVKGFKDLKWDDPSTWTEPAKNAAFGLLGWAGLGKPISEKIVAEAKVRDQRGVEATKRRLERQQYYAPEPTPEKATTRGGPAGSAFQPTTAEGVKALDSYESRQEATRQPNQAARRATIEVPEVTAPEEQYFTDAELEELTRPEPKPTSAPTPATFTDAELETAPAAPEHAPAPPAEEPVVQEPERAAAEQPAAQGGLDFDAQHLVDKIDDINKNPARSKAPELIRDAEFNKFASDIRNVYSAIAPDRVHDVEAAVQLYDEGKPGEAMVRLEGLKEEAHAIGKRNVEAAARKAGIELPAEEPAVEAAPEEKPAPKPRKPREPAVEERPKTAREHLIWTGADLELQNWVDTAEDLQGAREAERNATTMKSNVAGKEIEEEQVRRGSAIRSLKAKENTPLSGFTEGPQDLIDAGRKKSGKLYRAMQQAFRDAYTEEHGSNIDGYLEKATENQKRDLFGEDTGALQFEEKPGGQPSVLGRTEQEGLTKLAAGRKTEQLKEGKVFDEEGLVKSELFGGRGGRQSFMGTDERAEMSGSEGGDTSFDFAKATPRIQSANEKYEAAVRAFQEKDSPGTRRALKQADKELRDAIEGARATKPVVDQKLADDVLKAAKRLEFAPEQTVTFYKLRQQPEFANVPREALDAAILQLYKDRRIDLLNSSFAHGSPHPNAADDVFDPNAEKGAGRTYTSLARRADSEEGDFAKSAQVRSLQELGQGTADAANSARQALRQTFVPARVAESAAKMGLVVRRGAADRAARDTRAARALQGARRYFGKYGGGRTLETINPHTLAFYDAVEAGKIASLPITERGVAGTFRELLDSTWAEVRSRAGVRSVIDDYLPHLWADQTKATEVMRKYYAKRPLQGGKGFLKQREIMSIREGLEAGLELAFDNPVDMVLAQLHQENKFITGHDMVQEMKQMGVIQFRSVFDKRPAGEKMAKINDPIGTVYGPPTIKVKEAYDEIMFDQLNQFARSLGIEHFRQVNIGRHADAWGYTKEGTNKIFTKVGGPETVLTHEIGHQLDYRYDLKGRLTKSGDTAKELRALADLRYEGRESLIDPAYKQYVRRGSEKVANLIHAMIHAPELAEEVAPQSVQAVRELAMLNPELRPLLDIKPSLVIGEAQYDAPVGGTVTKGYWYAPEPAARIINNYLGPGLAGKLPYDIMRATGNLLNQVQLGASAFHFSFTALDSASSMFSAGLQDVMAGRISRGALRMAGGNIFVAPWYTAVEGSRVLRAFYGEGGQGEYYGKVANDLIKAGGRAQMEFAYKNNAVEKFFDAWGKKDFIGAGFRAIPAAIEYAAKPIMEYWVPRQKLGAFAMLSQQMLEDLPPSADDILVRKTLSRAWDAIDDRMGQLVYDNLFWSRTTKDVGMVAVRSLGWNLGTWRHFGGAAVDFAQAARGRGAAFESGKFRITPRMTYALTFPIVIGLHGALFGYLMTGKAPQDLKDYFFPQTGKVTPTGEPERVSLPSYAKDMYAYGQDFPRSTATAIGHKLHPDISVVMDMLNNKDFYGTEIRHEDDPYLQQFKDAMTYIGKQYVPFSARNLAQRLNTKGVADTAKEAMRQPGTAAASFLGMVPAPKSLEQTPAERLAQRYAGAERSEGGRTKIQFERAQARNAIIRAFQAKDPTAAAQQSEALKAGVLAPSDLQLIQSGRNQKPLQRYLRSASLEQLLNVWDQANAEEKKALRPMVASRRGSQALTAEERAKLLPRANRALGEPR